MNAAVFLDKDGTLVRDVPFNVDPARQVLYPEAPDALRTLARAGYQLAVISNQPGIALGYFNERELESLRTALLDTLSEHDVTMNGFYYCPHHPDGEREVYAIHCDCRKPRAGLLQEAARVMQVDLNRSWMIGDILNDVEAGNRAGCRTILLDRGNETEWKPGEYRDPDYTAFDLEDAARCILAHESVRRVEAS